MRLTEDAFRALARSSPWRWRTLHFTRHRPEYVEAWLARPGRLRVAPRRGRAELVYDDPSTSGPATVVAVSRDDGGDDGGDDPRLEPPRLVVPQDVVPPLRHDGLVAERPDWIEEDNVLVEYDDPMWEDYQWVAMLDPAELGEHVRLTELEETRHRGRAVWRALARASEGYEPRCGCCALLRSEISDRDEYGDDPEFVPPDAYPEAYRVALDRQTGVLVELAPVGGPGTDLDLEIHAVDATWDDVLPSFAEYVERRPRRSGFGAWFSGRR